MSQPRYPTFSHPNRLLPMRRAFTMVEILTVIAIIALLATITVVGMRSVGGNAKEKQARTVLEVMRSALAQAVPIDDPKVGDRFYGNVLVKKYNLDQPANRQPGGISAQSLASDAVTLDIVRYLSSNAGVKAQIQGLPDRLRKTVNGVTVPIDPWGNEIKFVYGNVRYPQGESMITDPSIGGIGKMYSVSAKQYWPGIGSYTPPDSSYSIRPGNERALQSPDKGAFWVSAGEDGKFETHDDNLYSFEGN